MARLNLDLTDKTKSKLFIRAKKEGKSLKQYLLEAVDLWKYEPASK